MFKSIMLVAAICRLGGPTRTEEISSHSDGVGAARLSNMLCALHKELRFHRGREWTKKICDEAADAYIKNSQETGVPVLLGVAVTVQESDTIDTAIRLRKDGSQDSGLMGIHWPSPFTRGIKREEITKIPVNIQVGFSILDYIRSGKITKTTVKKVGKKFYTKRTACDHVKDGHEYWLHYNNGPVISKKPFYAKYDMRVGALYFALTNLMEEAPTEIQVGRDYDPNRQDIRTRRLASIIQNLEWADPIRTAVLTDSTHIPQEIPR